MNTQRSLRQLLNSLFHIWVLGSFCACGAAPPPETAASRRDTERHKGERSEAAPVALASTLAPCSQDPGAAPQEAFEEPGRGCEVQWGDWDALLTQARSNLSLGFGPECAPDELPKCAEECAASDPEACVGLVHARLRGSPVKLTGLLEPLTRACASNDAAACAAVANIWAHGLGTQVDRSHAFTYRQQACQLGYGAACGPLAHMYKNGGDGIPLDPELGYDLLKRGCQLGSANACNDLGWSIVNNSWSKPPDHERALRLFAFACLRGSAFGCGSLGEALENGWGIAPDREQARRFWSVQCDHHEHPEACAAVKRLQPTEEASPTSHVGR